MSWRHAKRFLKLICHSGKCTFDFENLRTTICRQQEPQESRTTRPLSIYKGLDWLQIVYNVSHTKNCKTFYATLLMLDVVHRELHINKIQKSLFSLKVDPGGYSMYSSSSNSAFGTTFLTSNGIQIQRNRTARRTIKRPVTKVKIVGST